MSQLLYHGVVMSLLCAIWYNTIWYHHVTLCYSHISFKLFSEREQCTWINITALSININTLDLALMLNFICSPRQVPTQHTQTQQDLNKTRTPNLMGSHQQKPKLLQFRSLISFFRHFINFIPEYYVFLPHFLMLVLLTYYNNKK